MLVTATFVSIEEAKAERSNNKSESESESPDATRSALPPSHCFKAFEQFYVRAFLSELIGHYSRGGARQLHPLTFAFVDYPFTKRKKTYATLPQIEKLLKGGRLARGHPETTPHIHALLLLHPGLVEQFDARRSTFESLFRSLRPTNCTLDIREVCPGDDAVVLAYAAELLRKPRHPDLKNVDLFTWLPKARSEPTYQKSEFEKELEIDLVSDRLFKQRHTGGLEKKLTLKRDPILIRQTASSLYKYSQQTNQEQSDSPIQPKEPANLAKTCPWNS